MSRFSSFPDIDCDMSRFSLSPKSTRLACIDVLRVFIFAIVNEGLNNPLNTFHLLSAIQITTLTFNQLHLAYLHGKNAGISFNSGDPKSMDRRSLKCS